MRALLIALLFPFSAFAVNTFVSTTGSDTNDCLTGSTPCRTIAKAAEIAQGGPDTQVGGGLVTIAAGVYTAGADILYYRFMSFKGDCSEQANVNIILPANTTGFTVQDHAIATFECMRFSSSGLGATAIMSRQFAIVDYRNIDFNAMPGGIHIAVSEKSKTNCLGGIRIIGGAIYHAAVSGQSLLTMNCDMMFYGIPEFSAFLWLVHQSQILMSSATFNTSKGSAGGVSYINDSSLLVKGGVTVPGTLPPIVQNGGLVQ